MINLLTLDLGNMDLSICLLQIFHVTLMCKYPQIWPLASVLEFTGCKTASPCLSGQCEKKEGTWPQLGNPSFFTRESAGPQQQGKQKVTGKECGRERDGKIFCYRHTLQTEAAAGMGSTQVPGKGKAIFRKLDHNLQLLMLTQIFL